MSEKHLSHPSVLHVAACLEAAAHPHGVIALADTARSAAEAAAALGDETGTVVETGAIVKTLMFMAGDPEEPVIALVAGDRQCDVAALAVCAGSATSCRRPDAAAVKAATGYAIGGVSPIGLPEGIQVFMDSSLTRFAVVWAAAGHPHCVFKAAPTALATLAGATMTDEIAIAG